MCDTFLTFNKENKRSFFAKNSDREPDELQFVYLSTNPVDEFVTYPYFEEKMEYINTSFKTLKSIFNQFEHPYSAFISRPIWMWGAEMGVNEFGLAIGNEAVFSKEKIKMDGLLGMDILRLALHNNKTAKEALDFIIEIIEKYGQGGDGGYKHSLKYHNSFLIKDFNEAFILETSSTNWVVKKVTDSASISNCYTIKEDYEQINFNGDDKVNFKRKFEDKLFTFFSKGNSRQQFTTERLLARPQNLSSIKELLRTHIGSYDNEPIKGTGSICVHSGKLIKSETTSSMIVDYLNDEFIVWYTSSPNPCTSIYKPFIFNSDEREAFTDIEMAINSAKNASDLAISFSRNYIYFDKRIKGIRDTHESELEEIIYTASNKRNIINQCILLVDKYNLEVAKVLSSP